MLELVAQSPGLRLLLLLLLFAIVVVPVYLLAQALTSREATRQRLLEAAATPGHSTTALSSLRNERVESTWLKLVNSIEQSGISLVDTKDSALRQRLITAG